MEAKTILVKGYVKFAGIQVDRATGREKNVITLEDLKPKKRDQILDIIGDEKWEFSPLKSADDGEEYFKAQTSFDVSMYDAGEPTDEYPLESLGKGSLVIANVKLAETVGPRKRKGVVAYLKDVNILKFEEKVPYNPFEDAEDEY